MASANVGSPITSCHASTGTATADPNELVQHRLGACRYCHGVRHQYQWKTDRELIEAQFHFDKKYAALKANVRALMQKVRPDDVGGYRFKQSAAPNPDCLECDGRGESYLVYMDTTKLSPKARLLYNGVKETRQGRQVLMADRQAALGFVARRLGLFKEPVEGEASPGFAELLDFINTEGSAAPIATALHKFDQEED